ncbi:hypothetical protein NDU88_003367 [Pleurodeles waltl]|uniref:Secreted protein n=1 Tax=Pleurodeles waltl TaxID=8319 RepID=A0AAV7MU23_PLEWA|nr:hypothetical protein NDU88_003367 [Pleurodeles waltl]
MLVIVPFLACGLRVLPGLAVAGNPTHQSRFSLTRSSGNFALHPLLTTPSEFADVPFRIVALAVGGEGVWVPCAPLWMMGGSSPPRGLRILPAEGRGCNEFTVLLRPPFWIAAAAKLPGCFRGELCLKVGRHGPYSCCMFSVYFSSIFKTSGRYYGRISASGLDFGPRAPHYAGSSNSPRPCPL